MFPKSWREAYPQWLFILCICVSMLVVTYFSFWDTRESPHPFTPASISFAYLQQLSSTRIVRFSDEEANTFVQLHNAARRIAAPADRASFEPFMLYLQNTTQQSYIISLYTGTCHIRVASSPPPHSPPLFSVRSRKFQAYYLESEALYDFLQSIAAQQSRWEELLPTQAGGRSNAPPACVVHSAFASWVCLPALSSPCLWNTSLSSSINASTRSPKAIWPAKISSLMLSSTRC